MDTINCPVCNEVHKIGEFCPKCGFESRLYAQQPPETIMKYEQERIEGARKAWKDLCKMIEQRDEELNETREQLKSSKSKAEKLHSDIEKEADKIKDLTRQLNDATSTGQQQARRIDDLKKKLSQAEWDIHSTQRDLQSVINLQTSEIADLKESLKDTQDKLIQLSAKTSKTLKGVVIVEDVRHDIRTALPVYEGLNTYGSDPDKDSHCQIKFNVRGFRFLPVHFSVMTSAKGLILEGFNGANIYQNGGLIKSGVYARQADKFMLDDKVRINVTQI